MAGNPNPQKTGNGKATQFQPGNQMAKLSIGKKRRALTSSFLAVLDNDKLQDLCSQLYNTAMNSNSPDQQRARELLMKYSIVPTSQQIEVKQKPQSPQILGPENLDEQFKNGAEENIVDK